MKHTIAFMPTIFAATLATTAWGVDSSRVNLGIYGGTIMSTAFDKNSSKLFAAVAGPLSLFESSDTGTTWVPAFPADSLKWIEGQNTRGWAGRGMNVWSTNGTTVCRSVEEGGVLWAFEITSDGKNWKTLWDDKIQTLWRESYRAKTTIDPFLGSINTAAIVDNKVFLGASGGILYRSLTEIDWNILPFPNLSALTTQDANLKYRVASVIPNATFSKIFVIAGEPGNGGGPQSSSTGALWVTNDTGKTWSPVPVMDTIKLKDQPDLVDTVSSISTLFISSSPDTLYLINAPQSGTATPQPQPALFKSCNGGTTWAKVIADPAPGIGQPQGRLAAVQIFQDALLPGTSHIRLISGSDYSDDIGVTWKRIVAANGEIGQVTGISAHIPESNVWFARSDMGPKTGKEGIDGAYTLGTDGLASLTISRVAQLPGNLNRVYLATNTGIAFTSAYANSTVANADKWKAPHGEFPIIFDISASVSDIAINPWDSLQLVAASGNGLARTTNGGLTKKDWTFVSYNSIPGWNNSCWVRDIEYLNKDTVFVATRADQSTSGGLLVSYNAGVNWQTVATIGNRPVNSVTVAENKTGTKVIYVGTGKGTVPGMLFVSSDLGATWDSIPGMNACNNPGRLKLPVRDVEPYPGSVDTIFISGGDNTDWAAGWSYDRGKTITTVKPSLGGAEMSKIAVNKNHPDSIYFAMRNSIALLDFSPVVKKEGDPFTPEWPRFVQNWFVGYPGEILYDIHFDDLMMASSVGAFDIKGNAKQTGLIEQKITTGVNAPSIIQSSATITVRFTSAEATQHKIELFDLRGRSIMTPYEGIPVEDKFEFSFSTRDLASGCYVIRVSGANTTTVVQKLTVY